MLTFTRPLYISELTEYYYRHVSVTKQIYMTMISMDQAKEMIKSCIINE